MALTRGTTAATILWSNVSMFLSQFEDTACWLKNLVHGSLGISLTGRLDDKLRAKAIYNVLFAKVVRTRVRIKKVDFSLISVNAFKFKCQSVQHFRDLLRLKMCFSSSASFRVRVMDVQSLTQ